MFRYAVLACAQSTGTKSSDQLPEEMRPSVRQVLRDAYSSADASRARRLLTNLSRRLRDERPGAAATNSIESVMGAVRQLARRAKRWRGGRMILRWTVTAVADAVDRFRRVTGAREGMTALVRALKDHENALATNASRKYAA